MRGPFKLVLLDIIFRRVFLLFFSRASKQIFLLQMEKFKLIFLLGNWILSMFRAFNGLSMFLFFLFCLNFFSHFFFIRCNVGEFMCAATASHWIQRNSISKVQTNLCSSDFLFHGPHVLTFVFGSLFRNSLYEWMGSFLNKCQFEECFHVEFSSRAMCCCVSF